MATLRSRAICALALSLIAVVDISAVWNIPFFTQFFGFVLLIFLPGFLLIRIVKPTEDPVEKMVFLIGFSVSFLMFVPLLMDFVYPVLGISNPIALLPLLTTFSVLLAGLSLFAYKTGALDLQIVLPDFQTLVDWMRRPQVVGLSSILVLGALGGLFIRFELNSLFSLLLTASIAIAVALLIVSRRTSPRFYPLCILVIALALQYSLTIASPYLFGNDPNYELYFANLVKSSGYWDPGYVTSDFYHADYPTMLSVSLLPNVFSILLNTDNVWVYEVIFPFIFAFVPVGLYRLYKTQLNFGEKSAFLSVFFFMSFLGFSFFWPRQQIALLFTVLVIMLATGTYSRAPKTAPLLVLFIGSVAVAHYTTFYIVLLYLFVLVIASIMTGTKNELKEALSGMRALLVAVACIVIAAWYAFVSGGAALTKLTDLVRYAGNTFTSQFLSNQDPMVTAGLGGGLSDLLFTHALAHYWVLGTEALITVGLALMIWRRKALHINTPFLLLSLASFAVLLLAIALPPLTEYVGATRIYFLMSLFLAPYCIFAIEAIAGIIGRWSRGEGYALKLKHAALVGVLVPYFLFNCGAIFEVTEHPSNFAFLPSPEQSQRPLEYAENASWSYFVQFPVATQGVYASAWLSGAMNQSRHVYIGQQNPELVAYGNVSPDSVIYVTWAKLRVPFVNSYVYLGPANVQHGTIGMRDVGGGSAPQNFSSYPTLTSGSKVYGNGLAEVYYYPP